VPVPPGGVRPARRRSRRPGPREAGAPPTADPHRRRGTPRRPRRLLRRGRHRLLGAPVSRIGQVADTVRRRVDELARKVFPGHWSFLLGEVAMFAFVVLVLTGGYLAWFYEASG